MLSELDKSAVTALVARYIAEMDRRTREEKVRDEAAIKIQDAQKNLNACSAGLKLFGIDTAAPNLPDAIANMIGADNLNHAVAIARPGQREEADEHPAEDFTDTDAQPPEDGEASMKIRDIVLDRLKAAGAAGSKAAPIRDFIENALGTKIHPKTTGMSLYRLSKEQPPLVRRDGQIWFYVAPPAQAENPGGETPGPINSYA